MSFKREERYLVLKIKDILRYTTLPERLELNKIYELISAGRQEEKRIPLTCVVVESDWPMYEKTWKQIEIFDNKSKELSAKDILNLSMKCDDVENVSTIREYLLKLLETLWTEQDNFSGKRPFGNSGWEWDVYKPLIVNGVVAGELDAYGDVELLSKEEEKKAWRIIQNCIKALGNE